MDLTLILYIVLSIHGAIMVGAYFLSVPILFNLYIFDNTTVFQDDASGVFSIIELCFALSSLIIFNVAYYLRPRIDYTRLNGKSNTPYFDTRISKTLVFFYASFFIGSLVFTGLRLGALGFFNSVLSTPAVGTCADTSWDSGCPATRFNHFAPNKQLDKINKKDQCMFLAYNENNITTEGSIIDWSLKENYDASKRNNLVNRANLNLNIPCVNNKCNTGTCQDGKCIISENDLPSIHWCWYWGCNDICNDRYVLNRTWLGLSITNTVIYLVVMIIMILSIYSTGENKKKNKKKTNIREKDIELSTNTKKTKDTEMSNDTKKTNNNEKVQANNGSLSYSSNTVFL